MDAHKYLDAAKAIYQEALEATISLLKNNPSGSFIAIQDWDDYFDAKCTEDGTSLSVWAVGVNDEGHLLYKAYETQQGEADAFEWNDNDWADIEELPLNSECFPELYRFVVDELDSATTKEAADEIDLFGEE